MVFSPNAVLIVLVLVVIAVVAWVYWPSKPGKKCVSALGATGDCESDSDCANGGHCKKDSTGKCVCVCAPGYSGPTCGITGVPVDSYNCMGLNQVPPNPAPGSTGSPNNLCVCPPGNWVSGTDSTGQYVQCLKCADNWGPIDADDACTMQWTTDQQIATKNCYTLVGDPGDPCIAEYDTYAQDTGGPGGAHGSVSTLGAGPCWLGAAAACSSCPGETSNWARFGCSITGWTPPNADLPTCASEGARKCSSYSCPPPVSSI